MASDDVGWLSHSMDSIFTWSVRLGMISGGCKHGSGKGDQAWMLAVVGLWRWSVGRREPLCAGLFSLCLGGYVLL